MFYKIFSIFLFPVRSVLSTALFSLVGVSGVFIFMTKSYFSQEGYNFVNTFARESVKNENLLPKAFACGLKNKSISLEKMKICLPEVTSNMTDEKIDGALDGITKLLSNTSKYSSSSITDERISKENIDKNINEIVDQYDKPIEIKTIK